LEVATFKLEMGPLQNLFPLVICYHTLSILTNQLITSRFCQRYQSVLYELLEYCHTAISKILHPCILFSIS